MRRVLFGALLFGFVSSFVMAQAVDIPLTNWTVPPYRASGVTTMTDATPPRVFVGVQPCRLVDTRAGSGFPAGFGPPGLTSGAPRNFDLVNGPCPGLPVGIDAYSLNVTVVNTAGPGHLVIYPQGGAQPTVSSINYVAGQTIANAVIVPAGTGAGITVVAGVSGTDLLIDINGYFSDTIQSQLPLLLTVDRVGPAADFRNTSLTCSGQCGVSVFVSGNQPTAIYGNSGGGQERGYGVLGQISFNLPLFADSAGVRGDAGETGVDTYFGGYSSAGVRGQGNTTGVLGIGGAFGVVGDLVQTSAPFSVLARGILGFDGGATKYAVYGAVGDFGGTGAKFFVEPHPTDASKVIRYVSLEGPEAGTYFRGRGRFERGIARIRVPEDFRIVTDEEGLTVQVTPIGPMATFSVLKADLNEIVVQCSRNVEFYYLVQGVRGAFRDFTPVSEGREFLPQSADARLPAGLPEESRRRLIANGTYNSDGTVNMETARRLGWDRRWAERERPAPQSPPE